MSDSGKMRRSRSKASIILRHSTPRFWQPFESTETVLKIGVVGAGEIVENAHLPALLNRADVRVLWVGDTDSDRAARLSAMFGVPAVSPAVALAAIPDLDVCLIAIPYGVRANYLEACAVADVAAYVEKPFAVTLAEHLSWCRRFSEHKLAVGFQRRFYHSVQLLRQVIAEGIVGIPKAASIKLGTYSLKSGGGRYITDAALSGGGVTNELGIHLLDQLAFVLRADSVNVEQAYGIVERGLDFHVEFSGRLHIGKLGITVKGSFSRLKNLRNGLMIAFDNCVVHLGPHPDASLVIVKSDNQVEHVANMLRLEGQRGCPRRPYAPTAAGAFATIWGDFLKGIREKIPSASSAASGSLTTDWVERIYAGITTTALGRCSEGSLDATNE